MALQKTPSYTFVNVAGRRTFFHRWHDLENDEVIECCKCGTTCKETDAYSQHWLLQTAKQNQVSDDELNRWQRTAVMKRLPAIVSQNIESFMLSDAKVTQDTHQFLLDAGLTAIPDLLRVLYAAEHCKALMVRLKFFVEIKDEMFVLQTNELEIKHHSDIRESVDMMFLMSLERLRTFMILKPLRHAGRRQRPLQPNEYRIKRIHISAQRIPLNHLKEDILMLPLHFRQKNASKLPTPQQVNAIKLLTWNFRQYLKTDQKQHFKPPFPCNLYCFRTCPNTQEVYAVPYHFTWKSEEFSNIPNFIILENIRGEFQQLQEIADIKKFLQVPQHNMVVTCRRCQLTFVQPTELYLHLMLTCGNEFEILQIHPDVIEIYEHCYELWRKPKWMLYGIVD